MNGSFLGKLIALIAYTSLCVYAIHKGWLADYSTLLSYRTQGFVLREDPTSIVINIHAWDRHRGRAFVCLDVNDGELESLVVNCSLESENRLRGEQVALRGSDFWNGVATVREVPQEGKVKLVVSGISSSEVTLSAFVRGECDVDVLESGEIEPVFWRVILVGLLIVGGFVGLFLVERKKERALSGHLPSQVDRS